MWQKVVFLSSSLWVSLLKENSIYAFLISTRLSGRQAAPHSSCSLRSHQCGGVCQVDVALTLKKIVIYTDRQTEHSFIIVDESKGLAIIQDLTAHGAIKNDYMAML